MRRVTVEKFVKAVKKTGVIPARCLWVREVKDRDKGKQIKACGIGTMAVAAGRGKDYSKYARQADGLGLTNKYIAGYITGFDGFSPNPSWGSEEELGYEDGKACAHAVFDQRLHERYNFADTDMGPYMDTPYGDDDNNAYVYTGNWG